MNKEIIQATKKYNILIHDPNDFNGELDIPLDTFILFYMGDHYGLGEAYRIRILKRYDNGIMNSFGKSSYIEEIGVDTFFIQSIKGINDKIKGYL